MRRVLRSVRTEEDLGAVIVAQDGTVVFDRAAGEVLRRVRRELGDRAAGAALMSEGWSNGYLYLAEPTS